MTDTSASSDVSRAAEPQRLAIPVPARSGESWLPPDTGNDPFRLITDNQIDMICLYRTDGTIEYTNHSYARFFGHTPASLVGTYLVNLSPPEAQKSAEENLHQTVASFLKDSEKTTVEFELSDFEGNNAWIEWSNQPVFDDQGKLLFIVSVGRDVTARYTAQAQLLDMNQRLADSNRDLQDFAYVASHDLQEPLRKIIAFSGRLAQKAGPELGEKNLDYLDRIGGAAHRMQRLIEDLLEVSRVATKGSELVPTDLNVVLADVVSDLEVAIERANATVTIAPDLPSVPADDVQMRQLFQNLIGNALKFRADGRPPQVSVTVKQLATDDLPATLRATNSRFVQLSVADNGIGFDEVYADKIFTVFQRLHGRDAYEGSGIGLSVCKRIIDRHQGLISAHSVEDQGATFNVILPLSDDK